jgi:hypothetical protein
MAGIRDLMFYLRNNRLAGAPMPQQSLIFGISQPGRLIQTMLLRGLHVDEDGGADRDRVVEMRVRWVGMPGRVRCWMA